MPEVTKKPWESKVMLLNAIVGLAAFVSMFWSGAEFLPSYIASHPSEVALSFTLLNMVLRMFKSNIVIGE